MSVLSVPYSSLTGTGWVADGGTLGTYSAATAGAAAEDIGLFFCIRDRTSGGTASMSAPSGWTRATQLGPSGGDNYAEMFYKRFTSADLASSWNFVAPSDSDNTYWRGLVRGCMKDTTPITGAMETRSGTGSDISYPAVTFPYGSIGGIICFFATSSNFAGNPATKAGWTASAYSSPIQWEANGMIFHKMTGNSGAVTPIASEGWGSEHFVGSLGFIDASSPWLQRQVVY